MRRQHSISLTGSHVVLHGAREMRSRVRSADWRAALSEVLAISQAESPRDRLDVRVQLGADHARVAIMTIERDGGLASVPAAKQDPLVRAWASDMLHITASEQVIRWRALGDPRRVLVSCVARAVAEDVEQACEDAGAVLASCRPAVLAAIDAVKQLPPAADAKNLTLIWTENGAGSCRHATVQLLRFRDRHLMASWRGWLPPEGQAGEELEAMAERLESQTDGPAAARTRMHWPAQALA